MGMERKSRNGVSLVLIIAALALGVGCDRLRARDLLNKGVQAYKNGQFDQAIDDFQRSKALDPGLVNARLYLATAYSTQYIPGAPSEENVRLGEHAIQEFKEVLEKDSSNVSAIDGIGAILFNMGGTPFDPKKFEESKTYHERHIQLKPEDPEPYYWIGVIDWSLAFRGNKDMRADYNQKSKKPVKDTDPMPAALATEFSSKLGTTVEEGITNLKKAIELRSDYDDAMAYLNLLYRQKADMESTTAARDADYKMADDLVDKVKAIKQKKMENPTPTT
jgi:tetratricopeptide (TPR) repeat protein